MRLSFYYPRAMTGNGGPTVTLWAWAGALAERGHQVDFVHAGGSDSTPLQEPGVSTTFLPHAGRGRTLRPLDLGDRLDGVDLLVLNSGYVTYNLVAGREASRRGVPYIVFPQGAYDPQIRARRRTLKRVWEVAEGPLLERALGVHVAFESEVPGVVQLAPNADWIVAPTGASVSQGSWEGGGGYLAWLGRYDMDHKGLDILLRALALISPSDRPKVVLHGRDHIHSREQVEELAHDLGLGAGVEVRGPVVGAAKREFLGLAEGYVLPSRWECHSTALLENLAMGVPCLVSSGAHISHSLQRADAAIVFEPADAPMARGLTQLIEAGPEIGVNARRFVEHELDWDRVVHSFEAQVHSLLES